MVLQVGDKVVIFNSGTPNAMAVKWEACKVGDKVNVVTLSDGTKIAMPRLELDTRDYVWKYPEIPVDFPFDTDFTYGVIPLGAAVFKITGVPDCHSLEDDKREWDPDEIIGKLLLVLKGKEIIDFLIVGYVNHKYLVVRKFQETTFDYWELAGPGYREPILTKYLADFSYGGILGSECLKYGPSMIQGPSVSLLGISEVQFSYRYYSKIYCGETKRSSSIMYGVNSIYAWISPPLVEHGTGTNKYKTNPDYPEFTTITHSCAGMTKNFTPLFYLGTNNSDIYPPVVCQFTPPIYIPDECETEIITVGDKYVIYNPVTKRLVFNDAPKLATAIDWRTSTGIGDAFMTDLIEYAWDGLGHVYLSQSKTTLSTIFYEDSLRVQAAHGSTLKEIPFHTNDLYVYSGETVSRELVDITSILVAGANDISLAVKNTLGGAKIGFATPVYIIRSMD